MQECPALDRPRDYVGATRELDPPSTLVKVAALVDPRALVEIEALAVVPRQG